MGHRNPLYKIKKTKAKHNRGNKNQLKKKQQNEEVLII